jgi:undecaprenyl-diphosphatase
MLNALLKDGLLSWILEIDRWLLVKINSDWSNSFFDAIFPIYRHSDVWIPLYFFLFMFMILNFGWRSIFWMLFLGLTAGICDQISSGLIKDWVGRTRPCGDPSLVGQIHLLLNRCPVSGSFTSSHATNHFGVAMFIFLTMKDVFGKRAGKLFFVWAATICYGQVYVGVHYPLDVIGGGILGCGIGYAMALIFKSQPYLHYKPSNVGS